MVTPKNRMICARSISALTDWANNGVDTAIAANNAPATLMFMFHPDANATVTFAEVNRPAH
jgi:hypothetical protein